MFLQLTEDYVASKFYRYCGKPSYNRAQKVYQGSCPICHEGSSWLKKRRCYYIVAKKSICCHNCGWFSNPYNWIQRVAGLTFLDIKKEIEEDSFPEIIHKAAFKKEVKNKGETETLPSDSINLFNPEQIEYYRNNNVIQACLKTIRERKLDTAVNRPFAIYTTLSDRVHLNRLIIPFIDYDNKIIWYQSRKVLDNDDRPKYLSKVNSERALFGANSVDENYNYIFITEGPIDAMFIKNGVGVAGINEGDKCFTNLQERQFLNFPLHEKIWVLDNQFLDSTSKQKTKRLLDNGERVFLWPESLSKYKDLNDYCCDKNVNCIDPNIILENSYKGLKGKLLASK